KPVTPIAFPHSGDEDDTYKGYHIPKGKLLSLTMTTRAVTQNEAVYSDPEEFKPERFIKDNGMLTDDNVSYMFGFGRRTCPGKYMADMVVWLVIASVLAMFNISKARDENGNEIKVNADVDAFTDAVTP
ncbi:Cytochrome P450, partial [Amanita muscaria]